MSCVRVEMWRWKSIIRSISPSLKSIHDLQHSFRLVRRSYSDVRSSFIPFSQIVTQRQSEARKSILVQVNSEKSFNELYSYCSQFGPINGVHHYSISSYQHFMLVEFATEECISDVISSTTFFNDTDVVPVESQFLWFRPQKKKMELKNILNSSKSTVTDNLIIKDGCKMFSEKAIFEQLSKAKNITEQIDTLFQMTKINDLGTRLRYITARQIECALLGLYPKVVVQPFGSTVNGFGKMGCDLDLVMRFSSEDIQDDPISRLVFHTKKSTLSLRMQQQRYMEVVSEIIQLFLPGCSHVRKILQARIPIIKYNQDYAGLECDLSINSFSGVYMSELLYIYGNFDSRVKPLVFAVRKWAKNIGITNPSPGKWITNFPLTLMVLFYLQNARNGPILPPLNYLRKKAVAKDRRFTDDGVDCTFATDIKRIDFQTKNKDNLEELLYQFFGFYSNFDFTLEAISINEGRMLKKMDHSPLYIINPLETNLNVSKNVSYDECERIKTEFRNAAWYLESYDKNISKSDPWGLAVLLIDKNTGMQQKFADFHRLVSVKDLFVDDNHSQERKPEKLNMTREINIVEKVKEVQTDHTVFKNDTVKKQVEAIKNETKDMIKTHLGEDEGGYESKVTHRRRLRKR